LQAIAFQPQAAAKTLQKKSCLKTYRRFFVRSAMCHNRRVNVEMTVWNEGCEGCTAIKCPPALPAERFGARNASSAFGYPVESGAGARTVQNLLAFQAPIKPNQSHRKWQ